MSDAPGNEIRALDQLGDLFRKLDEPSSPRHGMRGTISRRGKLVLAVALALALVGCSLTPAGHTVTGKIARLVGIGEPATLPPHPESDLKARGQPVVLASGTAPDGSPYEIVADRSVVQPPGLRPIQATKARRGAAPAPPGSSPLAQLMHPPPKPATCLTVDLPQTPTLNTVEICDGKSDRDFLSSGHVLDGINYVDRYSPRFRGDGEVGPSARYVVTGELSPNIRRVEMSYRDANGKLQTTAAGVGIVTAKIRGEIHTHERVGYMVAFLPDDGQPAEQGSSLRKPGILGTVKLTGFDAQGRAVAHDDLGRRTRSEYRGQARRARALQEAESRVHAAAVDGRLPLTRSSFEICMKALHAGIGGHGRGLCFDFMSRAGSRNLFGIHTGP